MQNKIKFHFIVKGLKKISNINALLAIMNAIFFLTELSKQNKNIHNKGAPDDFQHVFREMI